ncbi:metal-dependent hydrolase [Segniliparus rugosus]
MSMTTPTRAAKVYPKVRRISFPFGKPEPMNRYFAADNIVLSHMVAFLSFAFPGGEDFFIRSVRRFSQGINDADLKKRVAGFVGQETVHSQQHEILNEKLNELGYRNRLMNVGFGFLKANEGALDEFYGMDRFKTLRYFMLIITAASEHLTAIAAERVLGYEEVQAMLTDPEVKNLFNWHVYEELEHKSVAIDVYRAAGGPEWLRVVGTWFVLATGSAIPVVATLSSILLTDSYARRHPIRVVKDLVKLLRLPFLKGFFKDVLEYTKWNFHPDHRDTTALLNRWHAELFGENGRLLDHLK